MIILAAIWGGVWWRFRGGALTALTGFDPGTGGMRAIAAVALSAPLAALSLWWGMMVPALWVGWCLAGWGAFQSMGTSPVEAKNPVARLLSRFLSRVPMCIVGMAIEGCYTMVLPGAVAGWIDGSWLVGAAVMLVGVLFSPIYLTMQRLPMVPRCGRFAAGATEWAEVGVGAVVMVALWVAAG